jgi:hypothetical protein
MPVPSLEGVQAYLGQESSWGSAEIESALAAESAAQARVCIVPAETVEDWPADLLEALYRRVAHNLSVRRNPNGVEFAESEFGSTALRVGGNDAEVNRLEGPWRVIPVA